MCIRDSVRPEGRGQGGGKELVRDLVTYFRGQGVEHVSLNVEVPNEEALAYWRRLGFTDYRRSLQTDLGSLEDRLAGGAAPSIGSVHLQTDDQSAVEKAVARFGPRVVRSRASVVSAPANGWIGVYDESAAAEPDRLRKLASELSYVTGGVVVALGAERGALRRTRERRGTRPSSGRARKRSAARPLPVPRPGRPRPRR